MPIHSGDTPRHRPGPFGPARILLPEAQKIEQIRDTKTTISELGRMLDTSYSQLPVVNEDNQIIGVFIWQSFGKRMREIHVLKVDLTTLAVKDNDLRNIVFHFRRGITPPRDTDRLRRFRDKLRYNRDLYNAKKTPC